MTLYKKILICIVSTICISLFIIVSYGDFWEKAEELGIAKDFYNYGDLYEDAPITKIKNKIRDDSVKITIPKLKNEKLNLYIIGDSYTRPNMFMAENFACHKYQFGFDETTEKLDTTKKNIILIEITERYFRRNVAESINPIPQKTKFETYLTENPYPFLFSNDEKNKRIELILTNNLFVTKIKEFKTHLYEKYFNYVSPHILYSSHYQMLYLKEVIDSSTNKSIYNMIDANEEKNIKTYLNNTYKTFTDLGFDAVYFSPIPDKSRIYPLFKNKKTNHFFELLKDSTLKIKVINCLDDFKKSKDILYHPTDTHWNNSGKNVWLNLLNIELINFTNL